MSVFMQFWVQIEMHCSQIVWKLYKIRMSMFTQRVRVGITVPRLCQKYTCSEWAWLYASGYPLKCIAPLFPIGTRNFHCSRTSTILLLMPTNLHWSQSLYVSFGEQSSLLWTHMLRPFYSRPIALTQEGRSLVNDVSECVRDWRVRRVSRHEQLVRYL